MARVVSVARIRDKLEDSNVAGKGGVEVKLARDDRQFFDRQTKWLIKGGEVKALPPNPSQKILAAISAGALVFIDAGLAQSVQPEEPENLSKASVESVEPEPEPEEKPAPKKKPAAKKKPTTKKKPAAKKKPTAKKKTPTSKKKDESKE